MSTTDLNMSEVVRDISLLHEAGAFCCIEVSSAIQELSLKAFSINTECTKHAKQMLQKCAVHSLPCPA